MPDMAHAVTEREACWQALSAAVHLCSPITMSDAQGSLPSMCLTPEYSGWLMMSSTCWSACPSQGPDASAACRVST